MIRTIKPGSVPAFLIALMLAGTAHAQASIGGTGSNGLGIFATAWTFFQGNALEGIIVLGVVAIGVSMMLMHFRLQQIAMVCGGAAIAANAVAFASGITTIGGVLGGGG